MIALETLKDVKEIGGFEVVQLKNLLSDAFVSVCHDANAIAFKIQKGPIKEVGVNGCQVDTLIHAAVEIISGLNVRYPSRYNDNCLSYLNDAIDALAQRTKDREKRGVEGTSQK